jgi:hypothetical protein
MASTSGYLVVSTDPAHIGSADARYRGLYRTPPFDQALYNAGFDDPYVSDEFVNEEGLLADVEAVEAVVDRFSTVMPISELEVLWVTTAASPELGGRPRAGWHRLGYDVACLSPFWSVVADPPEGVHLAALNEYGLLASRQAGELIRDGLNDTPHGRDLEMLVWEVWRRPSER